MFKQYDSASNKLGSKNGRTRLDDERVSYPSNTDSAQLADFSKRGSGHSRTDPILSDHVDDEKQDTYGETHDSRHCISSSRTQFMIRFAFVIIAGIALALASLTPALLPHTDVD